MHDNSSTQPRIILGSTSPYKKQLLEQAGYIFTTEDSGLDERKFHQPTVEQTVSVLAELKAKAILERHASESVIIITTDVAGELDGKFLGKPESLEQAKQMIMSYSNRDVAVWCGTTIIDSASAIVHTHVSKAVITFTELNAQDVETYVQEKQPLDKGGAIAIEEIEERGFIKNISGEYAAIIGISMKFVQQKIVTK